MIFINTIVKICHIILIIQVLIKKLKYLKDLFKWIKLYNLAILEFDKNFIIKIFFIVDNKNIKYLIFVAINLYIISTDNLNIRPIIE